MKHFASLTTLTSSFARAKPAFMTINPTAVARLKQIMSDRQQEKIVGVKISLTKQGCNGLTYKMDYIDQGSINKFDEVVQEQGVKVVIDSKALMAVIGTQMRFEEDDIGSQFVFDNPNEKGRCGCGASFHL